MKNSNPSQQPANPKAASFPTWNSSSKILSTKFRPGKTAADKSKGKN